MISKWDTKAQNEIDKLLSDGDICWDALVEFATEQSLGPALYQIIKHYPTVPQSILNGLYISYIDSGVNNALLAQEIQGVVKLFEKEKIPVVLLKGIALQYSLYSNPAIRPMQDLDILIHPENVPSAITQLEKSGYILVKTDLQQDFTLRFENEVVLRKSGALDLYLDMHWGLIDSPYYQTGERSSWFWENTRAVPVGTTTGYILANEVQLLYLCSHLALHHQLSDIIWVYDLALFIHQYGAEIDWQDILVQAQALDLTLPLKKVIPNLVNQWRVNIPAPFLEELQQINPSEKEARISSRIQDKQRGAGRRFRDDVLAIPEWSERSEFIFHQLFPSQAYMLARYNIHFRFAIPFYYVYRWYLGLRSQG